MDDDHLIRLPENKSSSQFSKLAVLCVVTGTLLLLLFFLYGFNLN